MTASIVPLRHPKAPPPLAELVNRVHELAKDSANFGFAYPHVQVRMAQRGIVMRQILETLQKGEGLSHQTDQYGDWRVKLRRIVCGRKIQVVVAIKENSFMVVTVI
jgi:hypothetical protein